MDFWWASHPASIIAACIIVFGAFRLAFGGGNYLPSKAWYLLCFVIPGFVVAGLLPGAFCAPIYPDLATALHLGLVLVYTQLDLCVARWLCGPEIGDWTLLSLLPEKFHPSCSKRPADGMTPPGMPPIARSMFEMNGALFHEIFWNIFICQNCIDRGVPVPLAILAVPAASCLVHGITSNANMGIRCFPNFVWVALSYHASGSVLVPGLIHAIWYLTDAKLCFALKTMKRDWDHAERTTESETPPWDRSCTIGLALILAFYLPLNFVAHNAPDFWRSEAGLGYAASCRRGELPGVSGDTIWTSGVVEWGLIVSGLLQIISGAATWGQIRAGMSVAEETGSFTEDGIRAIAAAVEAYATNKDAYGRQLLSSDDSSSSSATC